MPFEYADAASTWKLSLSGKNNGIRQFDYESISDVIIHMHYTAREGGELLAWGGMNNLKSGIGASAAAGTIRLFSIRQEFPNDWERFKSVTPAGKNSLKELALALLQEHYPYWAKGAVKTAKDIKLFACIGKTPITIKAAATDNASQDQLTNDKTYAEKLRKMPEFFFLPLLFVHFFLYSLNILKPNYHG